MYVEWFFDSFREGFEVKKPIMKLIKTYISVLNPIKTSSFFRGVVGKLFAVERSIN